MELMGWACVWAREGLSLAGTRGCKAMNETNLSHLSASTVGPTGLLFPAALIDLLPVATYACDAQGRLQWFNRQAAKLWGREPRVGDDGERFCGSLQLHYNGQAILHEDCPMSEALRLGMSFQGIEVEIERPDGSKIWVMVHIEPIKDRTGTLLGAINCFHETTDAHRAFEQLREKQRDLEDFFENSAVALHLVGVDGTILRANRAELELLGYSAEEYIGRDIAAFHADEDTIRDILARLSRGEKLEQYPARLVAKDGSLKHVLITSNTQFCNGDFVNTRCFTLDVTNWKLAQEKLREQDQRLAATYEHADIGIAESDAYGRLLRVNEPLCSITGYSREELLERTFFDNTHTEDQEPDRTYYRRQIAGELPHYAVEKRYVRKDGEVVWVIVNASSVRDDYGGFRYGVRVVEDITERKLAEQRLRESEHRFRDLINSLPAAVYTTDVEGRITFYNQAAVELAGRKPKIGSDEWCVSWRLFHPDGTPMPHDQCPMALALHEGRAIRGVEAIAQRPDGTLVPFIPYPTPLRDSSGALVGAVNMLVDISERKQAEANQRILLAELNHRVKNNMQMLHALLNAAQRDAASDEARLVLVEACRRVAAMGAAQQVLYEADNPGNFNVSELLETVCQSVREGVGKGTHIRCEAADERLSNNNAMPLALILNELLINAVKHGRQPGADNEIMVSFARDNQDFVLCVEDEGPGFDLEAVGRHASGLVLVKGLARQLGGELRVSRARGARCSVRFIEQWSPQSCMLPHQIPLQ